MVQRRILEHLKDHNWFAVCLEFIVVVVGIILAFQIDRWYEDRQLRVEETSHLRSLNEDFAATTERIEATIARHRGAITSAIQLLRYQPGQADELTTQEFYELLSHIQYIRLADYQRSTYDYLISSGRISTLRDEKLRAELTAIYSRVDGTMDDMRADLQTYWRHALEPFVRRNLDHVAMMQVLHPDEEIMSLPATLPADHFHSIIGSGEFEGLISDKWHLSRDLVLVYGSLLNQIQMAQERIEADLSSR